ncbi:uncharacterized protein FIBRA_06173 [Fibroporia radiculosa]|uniref:Uncharacterized protein n=1 Tax=Fibroporia radiculosa TaxID=599839 RepID=J4IB44_9APHY|nr:uncharacterized protein FIBRA_06173 [Fibroporia radiculosa]CCM04016.1 predicted protein [Fibroporia radiculosa]
MSPLYPSPREDVVQTPPLHTAFLTESSESSAAQDSITYARAQIDAEILQLERNIYSLKVRRNGLAPILHLPVELLADIFVLVATADRDDSERFDDLSWAKVSHVCQYWRNVSLITPRMWSHITSKSAAWVAMQLQRARSIPLVVHIDMRQQTSINLSDGAHILIRHMSRARKLTVSAGRSRVPVLQLCNHLISAAPLLESFVFRDSIQLEAGNAAIPVAHIPPKVFDNQSPLLWYVELHQCTLSWTTTLFGINVTHLILDGRGVRMRTSPGEIISALERMPMLQLVNFNQIAPHIPWDFEPRTVDQGPIFLRHLRLLHIDALALNCAVLLYNLCFPSSTQLILCCHLFRRYDEFRILGSAVSATYHYHAIVVGAEHPLQSFTFAPISPDTLQLNAWTAGMTIEELRRMPEGLASGASLQMNLRWDGISLDNSVRCLVYACRSLPLSNVRGLHVPNYVALTSRAWLQIFAGMRRLEAVWVGGRSANSLPRALRREVCCELSPYFGHGHEHELQKESGHNESGHRHGHVPALFPLLCELALEDVDFAAGANHDASFFAELQEVVIERCRHRNELKICIHRCRNLIVEQMHDLQVVGADVFWNGEELLDFDIAEVDSNNSDEDYEDFYDTDTHSESSDGDEIY